MCGLISDCTASCIFVKGWVSIVRVIEGYLIRMYFTEIMDFVSEVSCLLM